MDTLLEHLRTDRIQAMKDKNAPIKDALGLVITSITNKQIDQEVSEADVHQIIKKEIKSIRESAQMLADAGRPDEAADEQAKIDYLEQYLPTPLTAEEIETILRGADIELVASQRGRLIGAVMKEYSARVRQDVLQQVLNDILS